MDCAEVRSWLLIRPEEPAARGALEAHLRACPACAAHAARQAALDALLRPSLLVEPPTELSRRLVGLARASSLESRVPSPGRRPRLSPRAPRGWIRGFLQPAAAYTLAALVALWLLNTVDVEPWLSLLAVARDLAAAAWTLLISTAWLLLPETGDPVSWLAPWVAVLALAWLLRRPSTVAAPPWNGRSTVVR